jgi:hypothetical protein
VELRQELLDAIEKKRVETGNRTLQIGLWIASTIAAFALGWWTHDKAPQTSAPQATPTVAPSPTVAESPSATP